MGNSESDFDKTYENRVTGEDIGQVIHLLELYSKKLKEACDDLNYKKIADGKKYTLIQNIIISFVTASVVTSLIIIISITIAGAQDIQYIWGLGSLVAAVSVFLYVLYYFDTAFRERYFDQELVKTSEKI